MSHIKWANVPEAEVRAEVEAVLESKGEAKEIRAALARHPSMQQWRAQVRELCAKQISEKGMENLTPDILFDLIAAEAKALIPKDVSEDVKQRLMSFLQNQFEDHI